MKVLGVTNSNSEHSSDFVFLKHTLSLFKVIETEVLDTKNTSIENCALYVISIKVDANYNDFVNSIKNVPVLLLISSDNEIKKVVIEQLKNVFIKNNCEISEVVVVADFKEAFSNRIVDTDLILDLIRKINAIQFQRLKLKDDEYYTCGIDRSRNPCGDASEY